MLTVLSQIAQVARAGHIARVTLDVACEAIDSPAFEFAHAARLAADEVLVALLGSDDPEDIRTARCEGRALVTTARGYR